MTEDLVDVYTCTVCRKDFTESDQLVPRLLPCSHCFCTKCVEQILRGKTLVCPQCRKKHRAESGVTSFPQNKYILVILKGKKDETEQKDLLRNKLSKLKGDLVGQKTAMLTFKTETTEKFSTCQRNIKTKKDKISRLLNNMNQKVEEQKCSFQKKVDEEIVAISADISVLDNIKNQLSAKDAGIALLVNSHKVIDDIKSKTTDSPGERKSYMCCEYLEGSEDVNKFCGEIKEKKIFYESVERNAVEPKPPCTVLFSDEEDELRQRKQSARMLSTDHLTQRNIIMDMAEGEAAGGSQSKRTVSEAAGSAARAVAQYVFEVPGLGAVAFRSAKDIEKNIQVPQKGEKKCNVCHVEFPTTARLITHIQTVHQNQKNFVCGDCKKSFSTKEGLSAHMRTHTGKLFTCDYKKPCKKTFTTQKAQKKHRELHTKVRGEFPCRFKQPNGENCNAKGAKVFELEQYRDAHERICKFNLDPKKIQCTLCNAEPFRGVRLWRIHLRKVHHHN